MIGGKPITVQMPAGHQKTLTLVGANQVTGAMGKLVCLPNSTVTTSGSESKVMVVSRPRQPSATIPSASFDSPATTDAALAALAAEAGLIDPDASNKFESDGQSSFSDSGSQLTESQPDTTASSEEPMELGTEQSNSVNEDSSQEETLENLEMEVNAGVAIATGTVVGLFGGSNKLGLKGGGRFKIGLFGGSPITFPKKPLTWRKGLLGGGNGDSETTTNTQLGTNLFQSTTETVNLSETPANNFNNSSDTNIDNNPLLDIKSEYDEEEEDFKLAFQDEEETADPKSNEFNSENAIDIKEEFDDQIKREMDEGEDSDTVNGSNANVEMEPDVKKEDSAGDALSTLASAALRRATPQTYSKPAEAVSSFIFHS